MPNPAVRASTADDMRRKLPRSVAAPRLCSAILLLGARAFAQPEEPPSAGADPEAEAPPLRLSWSSSEPDCDGNQVAARALQMVGRRDVTPSPVDARAEVSRVGPTWTVKLETRSDNQTGTRILNGETCKEIQDAVALLLTMILESEGAAAPSPAPERPTIPPGPVASPAPTSRPLPSIRPEARPGTGVIARQERADTAREADGGDTDLGGFLRLHGGATLGLAPDVWLGFGAAAGVYWRSLDVAVTGNFWPSARADIEGSRGFVEISRLAVGLRGCFTLWSPGHLSLAGCLLPELTLFRYSSHDIEVESRGVADHLLFSGTSALELRYRPIGRHFSVVLSPGVTWEKAQPFHIRELCTPPCDPMQTREQTREVHRTTGLGGRLELGLEARF